MNKNTLYLITISVIISACSGIPSKIAPEQMQQVDQVKVTEAPAATAEANTEVAAVEEKTYKYKKVCKTYATTGTRFEKKVCRSQQAWDELERKAKESLQRSNSMQTNNPTGEDGPGGGF